MPYIIDEMLDDILDELEDADLCSMISSDTPKESTVNSGRVGREDICRQQKIRRPFIPKEEYTKQQRDKKE